MTQPQAKPPHANGGRPVTLDPDDYGDQAMPHVGNEAAGARTWAVNDEVHWGIPQSIPQLLPGIYHAGLSEVHGPVFERRRLTTDTLYNLPDTASDAVLAEIRQFWTLGEAFKKRGLTFKRGVMLYGPPGSGKTATLSLLLDHVVKQYGGIVLLMDHPTSAMLCLQMVRKIEPTRPIIGVIEDFDSLLRSYGQAPWLSILDGEAQVDNVVFVATTNYPELIPARFMDRPSRFDVVMEIGMPTPSARRVYLNKKEPTLHGAELDTWVAKTDGFSIAHLREIIILCHCYGMALDDAIARLRAMQTNAATWTAKLAAQASRNRFGASLPNFE